jgi:putative membrane protein
LTGGEVSGTLKLSFKKAKMKRLSIACAITGLQSFTPVVFAHGPEEGDPMGPWMMWWGHGMGWWIFPLVIIVAIIICLALMSRIGWRSSRCGFGEHKDAETPLDILKKRYAKGELSKEEFEAIKKDL